MSDLILQTNKLKYLCKLNNVDSNIIDLLQKLENLFKLQAHKIVKPPEPPKDNRMARALLRLGG
jgi:hypothetical protein